MRFSRTDPLLEYSDCANLKNLANFYINDCHSAWYVLLKTMAGKAGDTGRSYRQIEILRHIIHRTVKYVLYQAFISNYISNYVAGDTFEYRGNGGML